MATYRVTVKGWDRHFGSGHVLSARKFDVRRRSKKSDAQAIQLLHEAMALDKPQSSDKSAEAWVEVSDRFGPSTIARYVNEGGQWVEAGRFQRNPSLVSEEELNEGLENFEVLGYRVQDVNEPVGDVVLGIADALDDFLRGFPEGHSRSTQIALAASSYDSTMALLQRAQEQL